MFCFGHGSGSIVDAQCTNDLSRVVYKNLELDTALNRI